MRLRSVGRPWMEYILPSALVEQALANPDIAYLRVRGPDDAALAARIAAEEKARADKERFEREMSSTAERMTRRGGGEGGRRRTTTAEEDHRTAAARALAHGRRGDDAGRQQLAEVAAPSGRGDGIFRTRWRHPPVLDFLTPLKKRVLPPWR